MLDPAGSYPILYAPYSFVGAIETICAAYGADLKNENLWLKLTDKKETFQPLNIERNGDDLSIMHTFIQEGDLMRDPEVTFYLHGDQAWIPLTITQHPVGRYEEVVFLEGEYPSYDQKGLRSLKEFLKLWGDNLLGQYLEDGERPSPRFSVHLSYGDEEPEESPPEFLEDPEEDEEGKDYDWPYKLRDRIWALPDLWHIDSNPEAVIEQISEILSAEYRRSDELATAIVYQLSQSSLSQTGLGVIHRALKDPDSFLLCDWNIVEQSGNYRLRTDGEDCELVEYAPVFNGKYSTWKRIGLYRDRDDASSALKDLTRKIRSPLDDLCDRLTDKIAAYLQSQGVIVKND